MLQSGANMHANGPGTPIAALTLMSTSFVAGPARELYRAPLGSLSTAAAPAASPGTIFATAHVLFSFRRSAGLLLLLLAPSTPFAVKANGTGMIGDAVGQGLMVTAELWVPEPTSFRDFASWDNSTG